MAAAGYLASSVPLRTAVLGAAVAIPILAVRQTQDVALGGALVAAFLAPAVLAAPLVGVVLDRTLHPRRWMLGSGLLVAVALAVAGGLGTLPLPLVVVLLVVAGAGTPFTQGGLSSFVVDEIPDERRAYAVDALSYNVAAVAGPALVAVVAFLPLPQAGVWALALAALVGSAAFAATRLRSHAAEAPHSVVRSILAGLRQLTRHRPLAVVTSAGTISQLGAGGLPIASVALSVQRAGTPDDAAIIVTAFAIGGLVGALVEAWRPGTRFSAPFVMGAGFALTGIATLLSAVDAGLWWTVIVIGLSGVPTASSAAAMLLLRKQQSPPAVRSQVFTVGAGLRATASAIGAAVAGALAGLDAAVLIALVGAVWVVSGLLLIAYPKNAPILD